MARIRVGRYVVESDAKNWTVFDTRIVQDPDSPKFGQEYVVALGYFPRLSAALQALPEFTARSSEATTLVALLEELRAFQDDVRRALDNPQRVA